MPNELSGIVEFAGASTDRLVLTPIESLHQAIASRVFGALGPLGRPARFVHDGVAAAIYGGVRRVAQGVTAASAAGVRLATGDEMDMLSATRRGRSTLSALNALAGDVLDSDDNALAIQMAVRSHGGDLSLSRRAIRGAFPGATSRLAVFLHGLGESEDSWLRSSQRDEGSPRRPFGERLQRDLGFTPVYVRYNSGLHISDSGRRLSDLLERLVERWPVAPAEVLLVGHSMGGLVARSACHTGRLTSRRWPSLTRHLVTLGTPHTGVPLEKLVHAAAWLLRAVPESRPLANILDLRSAGIRDLRFGYVVEDDWRFEDPERLFHDRRTDVEPLPGCSYTFIAASVTRDSRHPLSWIGGDLLVRTESAAGRRVDGSTAVSADSVIHLGAMTHFDLLDHPLVYEHVRNALSPRNQEALEGA
ncbi:MAG TPA: alpha/beta fold hydrolase [Candidatus Dormibacteraeota bacterium]|nr:alpha/beta fold hydrolase [Candidatus Dormibacteraeota bacterium]